MKRRVYSDNAFGEIAEHTIHAERAHRGDVLRLIDGIDENLQSALMGIFHQFGGQPAPAYVQRPRAQFFRRLRQLARRFFNQRADADFRTQAFGFANLLVVERGNQEVVEAPSEICADRER
jgi:hypothetical protein